MVCEQVVTGRDGPWGREGDCETIPAKRHTSKNQQCLFCIYFPVFVFKGSNEPQKQRLPGRIKNAESRMHQRCGGGLLASHHLARFFFFFWWYHLSTS